MHPNSPLEKALAINLRPDIYGTFAEIGAGQEVVRWFFQAGGAAGTISKSISAYDMQVSDAIYGRCSRYVCRERLDSMLHAEQNLNLYRLTQERGGNAAFFSFADTVSARNYHGTNECHGWLGIRFQLTPGAPDSQITIHVRMLDVENTQQQEALGVVGVNLIYGAFFHSANLDLLLESLLDHLSTQRIEVDMVEFSGHAFQDVDNRVLSLRLVQLGMTGVAMFSADGAVLQPSEVLRKRSLVVERGRFRPVTHVNIDMLECAKRRLERDFDLDSGEVLPIMEITMRDLVFDGEICLDDFVSRAEVLETTGHTVMISDFFEFYRLATYLFRYTRKPIGFAMGLGTLKNIFCEPYYENLEGGLLGSFGRLFRHDLRAYVYPLKNRDTGIIDTIETVDFEPSLQQLFSYLKNAGHIVQLDDVREAYLDIFSPEVLTKIAHNDDAWLSQVPIPVADAIKARRLFGYSG